MESGLCMHVSNNQRSAVVKRSISVIISCWDGVFLIKPVERGVNFKGMDIVRMTQRSDWLLIMPVLQPVIILKKPNWALWNLKVLFTYIYLICLAVRANSRPDFGGASIVFLLSCPWMSPKLRGNDSHTSILYVKVTLRGIAKHHKMWQ